MKHLKISAVFVDLFAILVCFLFVQWYFAILLMHPSQEKKPTSKPRAEVIIADTWKEITEDVDIWIRRVDCEVVGYKNREDGPFKLHGDHTSENYGVVDGQFLKEATEVITITKKIPGTYQISLQGYRIDFNTIVKVVTEVELVDPYVRLCKLERNITNGEEVPVCEFIIGSDGEIVSIETNPDLLSKFLHLNYNIGEN